MSLNVGFEPLIFPCNVQRLMDLFLGMFPSAASEEVHIGTY